ncbi:hypothetical protein ALC62_07366 [Cyphomyrmex costatus]|uniref:Uncharacterized protein n=1 Tax=Cyphomyrmex costatus TaxID=456900 RepID=A0A195CP60_9HYME|nr:hypothetical protein ALC62_07366 [Cyphomyrmex costatus]
MSLLRIRIYMRAIKLTRFVRTKSSNYTLLRTRVRHFVKSATFYYSHISPPYLETDFFDHLEDIHTQQPIYYGRTTRAWLDRQFLQR